jgi:ATP-dependent helicase/nuclease subunit A
MTIHQAKGLEFPVVIVPDVAADRAGRQRGPAVRWDPKLGCVAKPPDDDPPPFPDLAWRAYECGESVADWREDLRTLYVACTRAEDYLILSAALPADFAPQTPWMLALAGRYDLDTGRCRVSELPDAKAPNVRVTTEPPEPPPRAGEAETPAPPPPSTADAVFRQAETLRRPEGSSPVPAADEHPQWDAEDGSDIDCWNTPR